MTSARPSAPVVRVAILGCGAVGASLVAHLLSRTDDLALQSGARIEIAGGGRWPTCPGPGRTRSEIAAHRRRRRVGGRPLDRLVVD